MGNVNENSTLLGYYAANSGNLLPTFRDILSVPFSGITKIQFLAPENGTDSLSRDVGKK